MVEEGDDEGAAPFRIQPLNNVNVDDFIADLPPIPSPSPTPDPPERDTAPEPEAESERFSGSRSRGGKHSSRVRSRGRRKSHHHRPREMREPRGSQQQEPLTTSNLFGLCNASKMTPQSEEPIVTLDRRDGNGGRRRRGGGDGVAAPYRPPDVFQNKGSDDDEIVDDDSSDDEPFEEQEQEPDFPYPQPSHHQPRDSFDYKMPPRDVDIEDERARIGHERQRMLLDFKRWEDEGIQLKPSKRYTTQSNTEEMKFDHMRISEHIEKAAVIEKYRSILITVVGGVEWGNKHFGDTTQLKLDGWSESVLSSIENYDRVFLRLNEKYKDRMQFSPEMELATMLGGSALMHHMTHSIMASAMPRMEDIAKENPELASQMLQEMSNQMRKNMERNNNGGGGGGGGVDSAEPLREMRGPSNNTWAGGAGLHAMALQGEGGMPSVVMPGASGLGLGASDLAFDANSSDFEKEAIRLNQNVPPPISDDDDTKDIEIETGRRRRAPRKKKDDKNEIVLSI